ncbi:MAG: hypothetical protein L6R36_001649 [Xanthoria steineri]|nr:MAG: hypothetical protein L6R36_001649 [Xanthoria steineri]
MTILPAARAMAHGGGSENELRSPLQKRQITISITAPQGAVQQDLLTIDVGPEMTIGDLKAVIAGDTSIQSAAQILYHNGQELQDNSLSLEQVNIKQDDMLGLLVRNQRIQPRPANRPAGRTAPSNPRGDGGRGPGPVADAEMIRLQALGNPGILNQIRAQNQELADAVHDEARWSQIYDRMLRQQQDIEAEKQRELALLNADPFNVEAQAKIEEMIRQERVIENLQHAMDHTPEAFGRVHMLYIDVEVNGHKVKAFVDSGAQATIMSPTCAEKCGIMRLIDRRFGGQAVGVGTAKILGRVHSAQIKIGNLYLPCSFSVMEGKDVDLLLGLDMLKRHQACIDLRKGRLVIQDVEVSFLGEADIPKQHVQTLTNEETVPGPSGIKTSAVSGAVQTPSGASANPTGSPANIAPATSGPDAPNLRQQASSSRNSFPDADITKLMELGVSRGEAINALELAGGNVDIAAGLLL